MTSIYGATQNQRIVPTRVALHNHSGQFSCSAPVGWGRTGSGICYPVWDDSLMKRLSCPTIAFHSFLLVQTICIATIERRICVSMDRSTISFLCLARGLQVATHQLVNRSTEKNYYLSLDQFVALQSENRCLDRSTSEVLEPPAQLTYWSVMITPCHHLPELSFQGHSELVSGLQPDELMIQPR